MKFGDRLLDGRIISVEFYDMGAGDYSLSERLDQLCACSQRREVLGDICRDQLIGPNLYFQLFSRYQTFNDGETEVSQVVVA